jgi:HlyD family secretion protein
MLRLLRRSPKATNGEGTADPSGIALASPAMIGDTPLALLEFQSPTAAVIATPIPPITRSTVYVVTALIATLLIIASTVKVSRLVTAHGKLVTQASTIVLQPFATSIVQSIDVSDGEVVRKGQLLARLNPTFADADLKSLQEQRDQLSAEDARLVAETSGTDYTADPKNPASALQAAIFTQETAEHNFTLENYAQKIAELQAVIARSNAEADFYRKRVGVASDVEGMRKELQKLQVGSKLNSLIATDDRLNVATSLADATATATASERDLAAQRAERDAYQQKWQADASQQLAETNDKLAQTEQLLNKASLQNQLVVLRAPRDSVVLNVAHVSVGSVMQSGEQLISLVPIDAPLSIEADISGTDSGYVHTGEKVTVKLDTLPFLQYGSARGMVKSISPDSFSPQASPAEGGSTLPDKPTNLFYRGNITLDELLLHDTPPGFRLMPGMPVEADIKVGQHTIMQYFISKVLPVAYSSLHEP